MAPFRRGYDSQMPRSSVALKQYAQFAAGGLVLFAIGVYHLATINRTPFWGDEGGWVGRSAGWYLLIEGNFDDPFWSTHAIDQPMLPSYAFGIVGTLSGYGRSTINKVYDYGKTYERNRQEGYVPDDVLLWRCRAVSTVFGVLACAVAMGVVWRLTGPVGGLAVGVLVGINPHFMRMTHRAMSEGLVSFWLLVTWFVSLLFVEALTHRKARQAWRRAVLLGLAAGLGTISKLTGVAAFFAVVGIGLVHVLQAKRTPSAKRRKGRWRLPAKTTAVAIGVGCLVFLAQSPTTWRSPLGGTYRMLQWRKRVAETQRTHLTEHLVHGHADRVETFTARVWHDMGTFAAWGVSKRLRMPWLDGWLFIWGLLWLLLAQRRARIAEDVLRWRQIIAVWIWMLALNLPVLLLMPADVSSYYLSPFIASAVVQAMGLGLSLQYLIGRLASRRRRSRVEEEQQAV